MDRPHRLVPFLSGAALAIIIDTGIQLWPSPTRVKTELIAEPAPKRPEVVPRPDEPPKVITQPEAITPPEEPVPPTRPSAPRRTNTPVPSAKDIEAKLTRALARKGLELGDVHQIESVKVHVARLMSAKDGREVEVALAACVAAIQNAELSHKLLEKKLEQVRAVLTESESQIPKERFQVLQGRYLDAKTELPGLSVAALTPFAGKVSKLLADIRAARSR